MAARDYAWLAASVVSWSHRKDLASKIADFVLLAEERISADLEARGAESIVMLSTAIGVATTSLPSEVIDVRSVEVPGLAPLGYLSADAFSTRYSDGAAGEPRHYTTIGDTLRIGPTPDAIYTLTLDTRRVLPPLSEELPVNWLITRNPSLYLAATMTEAMDYVVDPDRRAQWEAKYQVALKSANSTSNTAGQLVVRSDARTP